MTEIENHKEFLKKKFFIIKSDVNNLTDSESKQLVQIGYWLDALTSKKIKPINKKQRDFLGLEYFSDSQENSIKDSWIRMMKNYKNEKDTLTVFDLFRIVERNLWYTLKNFDINEYKSNLIIYLKDNHKNRPGEDDSFWVTIELENNQYKDDYLNSLTKHTRLGETVYYDTGFRSSSQLQKDYLDLNLEENQLKECKIIENELKDHFLSHYSDVDHYNSLINLLKSQLILELIDFDYFESKFDLERDYLFHNIHYNQDSLKNILIIGLVINKYLIIENKLDINREEIDSKELETILNCPELEELDLMFKIKSDNYTLKDLNNPYKIIVLLTIFICKKANVILKDKEDVKIPRLENAVFHRRLFIISQSVSFRRIVEDFLPLTNKEKKEVLDAYIESPSIWEMTRLLSSYISTRCIFKRL